MQRKWNSEGLYLIGNASVGEQCEPMTVPPEEHEDLLRSDTDGIAWDDVGGESLDPDKVREARPAEMSSYAEMGVCRKAPISERIAKTRKIPIGVRWVGAHGRPTISNVSIPVGREGIPETQG